MVSIWRVVGMIVLSTVCALAGSGLGRATPDDAVIDAANVPGEEARTGWAGDGRRVYLAQVGMGQSPVGITAFDSESGQIVWSVRIEPPPVDANLGTVWTSSIHVAGGVIAIATGAHVIRLDAATGTVRSIDDMLAAIDDLEPDNMTEADVVLLDGAALTVGEDHVVRIL